MARKLLFVASAAACMVIIPYLLKRKEWVAGGEPFSIKLHWRLLTILAIVAFLSFCAGASKIDDSYIYDRYIANALGGHGMVYNFGEHVNALSSPVFEYLLLLLSWLLGGHVLIASEVLSGVFMLLACWVAEWLFPLAGLFVASAAYFYLLTGMETTVFAFMLLATVALYVKGQTKWLPLMSVLLVLTRFEGVLLVGAIAFQLLRKKNFPPVRSYIPPAVLVVFYVLLNKHYYGVYLPSSATAKLGQGFSGYWGKWPTAFVGAGVGWLHTLFQGVILLTPVLLGLMVAGVLKKGMGRLTEVVVPFCVVLLLLYVGMNMPGDYFWYMSPLVLFALIFAAGAVPSTRWGMALAGLFVLVSTVESGVLLRGYRPRPYYGDYVVAGGWFREHTPKDARIAAAEIGILGWNSDRYLYDMIGLTSPQNAKYVAIHDSDSWLKDDRPDFIFVHGPAWAWEVAAQQSPEYVREQVDLPGGDVILRRRDYQGVVTQ